MKKHLLLTTLTCCFSLTAFSQEQAPAKQIPEAKYVVLETTATADGKTKDIKKTSLDCVQGRLDEISKVWDKLKTDSRKQCLKKTAEVICDTIEYTAAKYSFKSDWSFYSSEWPYTCEVLLTFRFPEKNAN